MGLYGLAARFKIKLEKFGQISTTKREAGEGNIRLVGSPEITVSPAGVHGEGATG